MTERLTLSLSPSLAWHPELSPWTARGALGCLEPVVVGECLALGIPGLMMALSPSPLLPSSLSLLLPSIPFPLHRSYSARAAQCFLAQLEGLSAGMLADTTSLPQGV